MAGVAIALRPVLCDDICGYIQELREIRENFSNVLQEIPNATHDFFVRMVRAYIDDGDEVCYTEYLRWWELAFPDHDHYDNNY